MDSGYDVQRLSFLLADLPVELLGRLRSNPVIAPAHTTEGLRPEGAGGSEQGGEFVFGQPDSWGEPDVRTVTETERYGTAVATALGRLHPRLTRRGPGVTHGAELPITEGTVIRLKIDRLPNGADPKPVWLWWSGTGASETTGSGTRSCVNSILSITALMAQVWAKSALAPAKTVRVASSRVITADLEARLAAASPPGTALDALDGCIGSVRDAEIPPRRTSPPC
ncbi:hypothetical protein ACIGPN_28690 [Streptomyces afghaniensis]|uniref:hypothetical protein n=1 Tax=Streptomyces afghaniensis TaxID=66865 RepID=UPI0037D79FAA